MYMKKKILMIFVILIILAGLSVFIRYNEIELKENKKIFKSVIVEKMKKIFN